MTCIKIVYICIWENEDVPFYAYLNMLDPFYAYLIFTCLIISSLIFSYPLFSHFILSSFIAATAAAIATSSLEQFHIFRDFFISSNFCFCFCFCCFYCCRCRRYYCCYSTAVKTKVKIQFTAAHCEHWHIRECWQNSYRKYTQAESILISRQNSNKYHDNTIVIPC